MRSLALLVAAATIFCGSTARAQNTLDDVKRVNLGPSINTTSIEIVPLVSADGTTLYFDRKFDSANVGGVKDQDDIYFSMLQPDGTWSPARNIGPPLNTSGSDVLFWVSSDGNTALVHNGAEVKGKTVGMAIARRSKGSWLRPVPLSVKGVSSFGTSYYAQVTPDHKHLLLAYAPDEKNQIDLDIYVCDAIGTDLIRWGPPRSLGTSINSSSFDGAPFLASDERTLYFASDGRGGMGSSDLFVSRRSDTGWMNWSEPVNLGGAINTPLFEASLSIAADGRDLYVSGAGFIDETSYGKADIFRIPLPQQFRPEVIVTIEGRLLAGKKGKQGLIRAERVSNRMEIAATVSDAQGWFALKVPGGEQYRLTGGADGYTEGVTPVDTRDVIVSRRVEAVIQLVASLAQPGEATGPEAIGIYFASGSAELNARAIAGLEKALATLKRDQTRASVTSVYVTGHTDDVGNEENNIALSQRRAAAAGEWLTRHGIDAALIRIEALGESKPLSSNSTERGRATNRRVDVTYTLVTTQIK